MTKIIHTPLREWPKSLEHQKVHQQRFQGSRGSKTKDFKSATR